MAKTVLFFALLALAAGGGRALTPPMEGFLERRPGASLLTRRHADATGMGEGRDHRGLKKILPLDDSASPDDSDLDPMAERAAFHPQTLTEKPCDRPHVDDYHEPQSEAPAETDDFHLPSIPTQPPSFDDVSQRLDQVTDKLTNAPGAGVVTNEDGVFGDLFSGDKADGEGGHEAGGSSGDFETSQDSDYITDSTEDVLPLNVEQLLVIDLGDSGTMDKSYISISTDLKEYQNTYIDCLDRLSDLDFNEANIERCVGKDMRYIDNDIEFFKSKILARADSIVRSRLVENCFKPAGADLIQSAGCDLLQKDVVQLLWAELNYYLLPDYHRNKYMFQHASMPTEVIDPILAEFKSLYQKQTDLLVELYDHKTLASQRVRDYVADRFEFLADMEEEHGPLHRDPLSRTKIIKVDAVDKKLKQLDKLRSERPWVMYKAARRAQQLAPPTVQFQSPWSNPTNAPLGRGPVERELREEAQGGVAGRIERKINASL